MDSKWAKVWCKDGFPKINVFFWIFFHRKSLTAENLRKRGIEGTTYCILYKEFEETLEHLFLECKFTQKVWYHSLHSLQFTLILPTNWNDMFDCWKDYYQGSLHQKTDLTRTWVALPNYICWKIWTAKNKEIFDGEASRPESIKSCKVIVGGGSIIVRDDQHR